MLLTNTRQKTVETDSTSHSHSSPLSHRTSSSDHSAMDSDDIEVEPVAHAPPVTHQTPSAPLVRVPMTTPPFTCATFAPQPAFLSAHFLSAPLVKPDSMNFMFDYLQPASSNMAS